MGVHDACFLQCPGAAPPMRQPAATLAGMVKSARAAAGAGCITGVHDVGWRMNLSHQQEDPVQTAPS
ncbi:hypothetical protein DY926_12725, partial [Komagataeibacter melaceti]